MALKMISRSCTLSAVLLALLTAHTFATHAVAARPLSDDKSKVQDEEFMTAAEMQKRYVRPDGAVEAVFEAECVGDCVDERQEIGALGWDRGAWSAGGGWDEGGNWDVGGGWTNRPPWATPSGGRVQ